jgi:integrase
LLVRGALETGARYGELCRLRVSDFNGSTVHIQMSKSGEARHILLTEDAVRFFTQLCAGREGDAPMFGREWSDWQQKWPIRRACERGRIEPPIVFHELRHTYASICTMNGMPLQVIARNLGHSNTKMCEKHYRHLSPGHLLEQVRQFGPKYGIADDSNIVPIGAKSSLR